MPGLRQLVPGAGLIFEDTSPSPTSAKLHSKFSEDFLHIGASRSSYIKGKSGKVRVQQVEKVYSCDKLHGSKTNGKPDSQPRTPRRDVYPEPSSEVRALTGNVAASSSDHQAPASGAPRAEKYGIDTYRALEAVGAAKAAFVGYEGKFDKKKQMWQIPQPLGMVFMPSLLNSKAALGKSKSSKKLKYSSKNERTQAKASQGLSTIKVNKFYSNSTGLTAVQIEDAATKYTNAKVEILINAPQMDGVIESSDVLGVIPDSESSSGAPELTKHRLGQSRVGGFFQKVESEAGTGTSTIMGCSSRWSTLKNKVSAVVKWKKHGGEDESNSWLWDCHFRSRGELKKPRSTDPDNETVSKHLSHTKTPKGNIPLDRTVLLQIHSLKHLQETLEKAGIDTSLYGHRPAKTVADLWDEMQDGVTEMHRPLQNESVFLLRKVRVLRVRLVAQTILEQPGRHSLTEHMYIHKVLVSNQQKRSIGANCEEHIRHVRRLPAMLIEHNEELFWSAMKCLREELGLDYGWQRLNLEFNLEGLQTTEEQAISESFPGLMTSYTFQDLVAEVKDPHRHTSGHLGLPNLDKFETSSVSKMEGNASIIHCWTWSSLAEIDGIVIGQPKKERIDDQSSMSETDQKKYRILARGTSVHRFHEAGLGPKSTVSLRSPDHLIEWLERAGIEVSSFGIGRTKTLDSLWNEYQSNMLWFDRTKQGTPVRVIRLVRIRMQATDRLGHLRTLVQRGQILTTGRTFGFKPQLPGKIARLDEEVYQTVNRVFDSLFDIQPEWCHKHLKIFVDQTSSSEEEAESKGYPGLVTRYFFCDVPVRLVEGVDLSDGLLGLPNFEDFDCFDNNGLCGKGVRNLWTWQDEGFESSASKRSSMSQSLQEDPSDKGK